MCTTTNKTSITDKEKPKYFGSHPLLKREDEFSCYNTCSGFRRDGDTIFILEKMQIAGIKKPVLVYNDAMDIKDIRSNTASVESDLTDIRREMIIEEGGFRAYIYPYAVNCPVSEFWRD